MDPTAAVTPENPSGLAAHTAAPPADVVVPPSPAWKERRRTVGRVIRSFTRAQLLKAGKFCHTSPFAAVAPWIGTLVGSWIVGANTGSVTAIVIGAVIAAIGCTPVAASAQWVKMRGDRLRRQDARERKVMEYASLVLLPQLGEFSHFTPVERVTARNEALMETVEYLQNKVYRDEDKSLLRTDLSTRVVLYAFDSTATHLEVIHQAGRPDAATAFHLYDEARGSKILNDLLTGSATYEPKLAGRNYVSYVSAPIITGDNNIYGMISVDTNDITQLDQEDGYALEVIASALAVFYQESAEHA